MANLIRRLLGQAAEGPKPGAPTIRPKAPEAPPAPVQQGRPATLLEAKPAAVAPEAKPAAVAPEGKELPTQLTQEHLDSLTKKSVVAKQAKRASTADIGHEMMISGMLSGPQTHIFNLTDNTIKSITAPLETATKAMVSILRQPKDKTYLRESVYQAYGLFHGYAQALRFAGMRAKQTIPGIPSESIGASLQRVGLSEDLAKTSKISSRERNITGEKILGTGEGLLSKVVDGVGAVVNVPGTMLNSVDMAGKIAHYNRIQFGQAAHLVAEGKAKNFHDAWNMIQNDPNVDKLAVQQAIEWTYQGEPSSYIKWILSPEADKTPFLRWVVPFRRAIANIYEHTLERSPLILTSPTLTKKLFSPDPAVADTARAKLLFGMTALTSMAMLLNDHMTGPLPGGEGLAEGLAGGISPKGRDASNMWERAYGKASSLRLFGRTWETREMGVYGNFLELIGAFNQWNANIFTPPPFKNDYRNLTEQYMADFMSFVTPVMEVLYDDHWGKNLVEFMASVSEAVNEGDPSKVVRFLERNLVKAIPIVGSGPMLDYAKSQDPYAKRKIEAGHEFFAQIPSLRKRIPNVYTWDGLPFVEDKYEFSQDSGRSVLDTAYGPKEDLDIIMGNLQVQFDPPQDSVSLQGIDGKRFRKFMNATEWREFNEMRQTGPAGDGFGVRQYIQETVINQPTWETDEPFTKKHNIETAYRAYVSLCRKAYFGFTAEEPNGIGSRLIYQRQDQIDYIPGSDPRVNQSTMERLKGRFNNSGE